MQADYALVVAAAVVVRQWLQSIYSIIEIANGNNNSIIRMKRSTIAGAAFEHYCAYAGLAWPCSLFWCAILIMDCHEPECILAVFMSIFISAWECHFDGGIELIQFSFDSTSKPFLILLDGLGNVATNEATNKPGLFHLNRCLWLHSLIIRYGDKFRS